ncbi:unnamed protein product [Brachionus calyciflorus]|uniref:Uncharacterized protein n=1 Tax=Brachionus calyciflorus TaxID=104777 RepID=A0A813ZPF2_9BILA|nr:unnamed protein product [Brachionus calyciflorus]
MDIVNFFEAKFEKNETPKSDNDWEVGPLDECSIESINKFGKAVIHNGKVYIAYCINPLLAFICSMATDNIIKSLNSYLKKNYIISTQSIFNVCNTYGNGYVQCKIPDAYIYAENDRNIPLVFKCAFANESLGQLIQECVTYINEFTRISYSIGFKVEYNNEHFKGYLFVFERVLEPNEDKIKEMNILIENKELQFKHKYPSVELHEFEKAFFNDEMRNFNVKVCFKKHFDDKNIQETVEFDLDKSKIDPEQMGSVKIQIEKEHLLNMFDLWKRKFHRREI